MMEMHALCLVLPEMPAVQFDQLAADIKTHGLRHPITTLDGKILDGRHRYRACIQSGVTPRYQEFAGGDPVAYVIGENLRRRQLTTSQVAMVAAKLADYESDLAQKRMLSGKSQDNPPGAPPEGLKGETREILGKRFGISGSTVQRGLTVLKNGTPELIEKVQQGAITVEEGARISKIKNKASQAEVVAIPSKLGRDAETQRRLRSATSKRPPAPPIVIPGTPFVKRFLSRFEALTNDLSGEFKTSTPEAIADRFLAEFNGTEPVLAAQFRRAMICMQAASIVVERVSEGQAA